MRAPLKKLEDVILRDRVWPRVLVAAAAVVTLCGWRSRSLPDAHFADAPEPALVGWADETRCAECHDEAEQFRSTGHAQTLQRATASPSWELLQALEQAQLPGPASVNVQRVSREDRDSAVRIESSGDDNGAASVELDWCFGSGHHARTWVGTLAGSWGATDLVEYRWTWYQMIDGFAITPGQPATGVDGYFKHIGLLYDYPKTVRCFGCHAGNVQTEHGRLLTEAMHPGVTCQSCHGPRERHLETGEAEPAFRWEGISRLESVHRCAVCHRRSDEHSESGPVEPDNPEIVRFQPMGLMASPCFQNSPEMTCITCHDPHRPLSAQDSRGDWQCVQCHSPEEPEHQLCGLGRRQDCLPCHMPQVEMKVPLKFTDHWIRIRSDSD